MINVLVATKVNGAWQKVAVVRASAQSYNLPASIQGQAAGYVARVAVDRFRAEAAAVDVDFAISGREYRATRFAAEGAKPMTREERRAEKQRQMDADYWAPVCCHECGFAGELCECSDDQADHQ